MALIAVEAELLDVEPHLLDRLVDELLGVAIVIGGVVRHLGGAQVQTRSRKRDTPSMALVCQGFTCSSGPMNIS